MSAFLTVAIVHILGVMSPGPDFVMVTKTSLIHSRRSGIWVALGIMFGVAVHVTYSLLGIGLVISKSILLFNAMKYLGAAYLLYIGIKALRTKKHDVASGAQTHHRSAVSTLHAIRTGFLCNVLNPKATLFFLAIFTQVVEPGTPTIVLMAYGLYMCVSSFLWFAFVASILNIRRIKTAFTSFQHWFERIMGGVLIVLGLKVALATRE